MFHVKHLKKCETWIKIEVDGENVSRETQMRVENVVEILKKCRWKIKNVSYNVSRETFTNLWDGVNDI